MKSILFVLTFTMLSVIGFSQSMRSDVIKALKNYNDETSAVINVIEVDRINPVAATFGSGHDLSTVKVSGYRVGVFFDNSQNARQNAISIMDSFREKFPDIPISLVHDNANFKVFAGYCLTKDEALIVWGRVKNDFNRAIIVVENIPISVFTE